jgi:hypothetical protein
MMTNFATMNFSDATVTEFNLSNGEFHIVIEQVPLGDIFATVSIYLVGVTQCQEDGKHVDKINMQHDWGNVLEFTRGNIVKITIDWVNIKRHTEETRVYNFICEKIEYSITSQYSEDEYFKK